MKLDPKQLVSMVNNLKADRSTWENHWQEVGDFVIPRRGEVTVKFSPGQKRNTQLFETTGQQSCILLAGALSSLLTNSQNQWFELLTGKPELDDDDEVRAYLQESTRRMMGVFNNSNFHTQVHEMYLDLCSFGTGCMSIDEDDETVVKFLTHHISEFMIRTNKNNIVDEVYRKFELTAPQIVELFNGNVSRSVQRALKNPTDTVAKFKVIQGIYPDARDPKKRTPNFPFNWWSQWIIEEDLFEAKVEGFNEFPYVAPRWSLGTGEMYGRSPAIVALPDIKMVNIMEKTIIKGAQKTVDPPLQAPDDGSVSPVRTQPGGMSYYRAGTTDRIEQVYSDFRLDLGQAQTDKVRERIKQAFFIDQLQLGDRGPQMTATEVITRRDQSMTLLGPFLARLQFEFLRPMIDRVFAIMDRRQMLPPAPSALRGQTIDVQYTSVIARVQRQQEVDNIQRFLETVGPVAEAAPEILDMLNKDEYTRLVARLQGLPQELILDRDAVEGIRNARAEAQQAQQDAVQEAQEVENASKLAKVVQ